MPQNIKPKYINWEELVERGDHWDEHGQVGGKQFYFGPPISLWFYFPLSLSLSLLITIIVIIIIIIITII